MKKYVLLGLIMLAILLYVTACGGGGGGGGGSTSSFAFSLDGAPFQTITDSASSNCVRGAFFTDIPFTAIEAAWNIGQPTLNVIDVTFPGSATGTFDENSIPPPNAFVRVDGSDDFYQSGTVNVTEYGGVGGRIAGNFDMVIAPFFEGTVRTFTGSFAVTRVSDLGPEEGIGCF